MYMLTSLQATHAEFDRYGKVKIEFSISSQRCDKNLRQRLQASSVSDLLSDLKDKTTSAYNSASSSLSGLF